MENIIDTEGSYKVEDICTADYAAACTDGGFPVADDGNSLRR